jgi:hypothetical protein
VNSLDTISITVEYQHDEEGDERNSETFKKMVQIHKNRTVADLMRVTQKWMTQIFNFND